MGKKKVLVILILVVVLVLGWGLAFKAVTHMDEIKKQEALVSEADTFMSRELYVRAIPLYEEAVKIKTTDARGLEVETKLVNAYYLHKDYKKFTQLVEKRAEKNIASLDEYMKAVNYYLDQSKMGDFFRLVKLGMKNTDSAELVELYEANRYLHWVRATQFTEIVGTVDNAAMPAFDGEKWGFVARDSGTLFNPQFDSVTAFTGDGIAAACIDGKFWAITEEGDKYGADDNPNRTRIQEVKYTFGNYIVAKKDGKYGIYDYDLNQLSETLLFDEVTRPSYGVIVGKNGSEWTITNLGDGSVIKGGIEDVAINSYGSVFSEGRGFVKIGGKWHLVDTAGNDLISETFVNAKAPESDGYIAVANDAERWGFINNQGELVIDYEYNDAHSFSDDVAAVQKYNDSWIYISKRNIPISEEEFDNAEPFQCGTGRVTLDGKAELIIFRYYEDQKQ